MSKRQSIITAIILGAAAFVIIIIFLLQGDLNDKIMIPYIAHQKPVIDPHLPNPIPLSDKLDEVQFDGLFNISANPSGIVYEDGLGEFLAIDANNVVSVKLKTDKEWHSSYKVTVEDEKVNIERSSVKYFSSDDLRFTMDRISRLGSLSPDYILVSQAVNNMNFTGPDNNGIIKFKFKEDRIWTEADIKEVLSFKVLCKETSERSGDFRNGTSNYLSLTPVYDVSNYYRSPTGTAFISSIILVPFIDNSTYTTELKNNAFNVMLETPFGSISPILDLKEDFFIKTKLSTTFFAILFNTERLNNVQRKEIKKLINNRVVLNRFFKVDSPQQREIVDYLGNRNNFDKYLNYSIFPSTSYYVEEEIIVPNKEAPDVDFSLIPDTVRIKSCLNFGYREELSELIEILNDPQISRERLRVTTVQNSDIKRGNYDAVLIAFTGYRSNFLFDLYDILLREPDLETYKINLKTNTDLKGNKVVDPASFTGNNNFFRLDPRRQDHDQENTATLLNYVYGFMSTKEIGDKQAYAERIDRLENDLALGVWLFSLPSLSYFSTQFDSSTIDLYGSASQLSTIEKWKERRD